jgi:hypothetical protein
MPGRVLPMFSTAFALCYGYAASAHLRVFIYYPALGEFATTQKSVADAGPPMLWYGWLAFAAVGGLIAMLVALALPRRLDAAWPALSCATIFVVAIVQVYLARAWFQQ